MTTPHRKLLFTNCTVWTGEIGSAARREVLVEDRHITQVAETIDRATVPDALIIDLQEATLIPGLVDGHSHLSFLEPASIVEFGYTPPEEHLLQTMHNAKRVLEAGFTSCVGASSAKARLDIAIRNAINRGEIPGPRLLASTPELTVTGGLGDERLLHIYRESEAVVVDGPDEVRKYVRTMAREGCDIIKLTISGSPLLEHARAGATVMTEAEIAAASTTAKQFGKRLASHSHSSEAVQLSIKHGIEMIHHATLIDAETQDMVEEAKDRIFLGPAIGSMHNSCFEAAEFGITPEAAARNGMKGNMDSAIQVYSALRKRNIRVVIGGDYGFAWTPHGTQGRDLKHFVDYFGYSAEEALVCGTVTGAAAMRMEDRIGRIKPGFLADMVAVRGKPHVDASCLSGPDLISLVVKDGELHGRGALRCRLATPGQTVAV